MSCRMVRQETQVLISMSRLSDVSMEPSVLRIRRTSRKGIFFFLEFDSELNTGLDRIKMLMEICHFIRRYNYTGVIHVSFPKTW